MSDPETIALSSRGAAVPALVYSPSSPESCPAVVLAAEAFGINDFTRLVASRLALEGYVVVVPDYYRGKGLTKPEGYDDFTEVMQFIEDLDFVAGTHDIVAGIDYARGLPAVDPARVTVWGYCTGGTLAMLAASVGPRPGRDRAVFSQPADLSRADDEAPGAAHRPALEHLVSGPAHLRGSG